MLSRDYRDIVGGGLLVAGGLGFAWYAAANYPLGRFQQMGPGMFPLGLGILLAIFGALIVLPALFRPGVMPQIQVREPIAILAGVVVFAIAIKPLGLIPATVGVTLVSSLAETRFRPITLVALSAALCLICYLVFSLGLQLSIPLFRWPF